MKAIVVTFCALLFMAGAFAQNSQRPDADHDTGHATHPQQPTDETVGTPASLLATFAISPALFKTPKRVRQLHRWQRIVLKNASAEARPS
jgi:hypothetical protein